MESLPLWAQGPFELIVHAEEHFRSGKDFDRRMALILFDNAIEVAITTYLSLHPSQRGGQEYKKQDCERWLQNYHSKLDFLDEELKRRGFKWKVQRADIIWAHDCRNEQYHGGRKGVPEWRVLELVREAALWIFGLLYDVPDAADLLEKEMQLRQPPQRDPRYDAAIDEAFDLVQISDGEQVYEYKASEVLFAVDYTAYQELGMQLCNSNQEGEKGDINA